MKKRPTILLTPSAPPCGPDCQRRRVGCHGECAAYLDWKAEVDAFRLRRHEEIMVDNRLSAVERAKSRPRR